MLLGVLDVVPRDVQEQRLDGDRLHLGRISDNILEVDSFGGVLAELVDQGPLCRLGVSLVGLLAQIGYFDQRPAALQLSLQQVLEELGVRFNDLDGFQTSVLALIVLGDYRQSSLALIISMFGERQRIRRITNQCVRASNRKRSGCRFSRETA